MAGWAAALMWPEVLADEESGTRTEGRPVESTPKTQNLWPLGTVAEGQSSMLKGA